MSQACIKQVACRNDRVQDSIGKGFLVDTGGQMKDERHILTCSFTVLPRQEIAIYYLDARTSRPVLEDSFYSMQIAGRPNHADNVSKSVIQ
jgi:hypothetical protein